MREPGHCEGCGNDHGPSWCEGVEPLGQEDEAAEPVRTAAAAGGCDPLDAAQALRAELAALVDEIFDKAIDPANYPSDAQIANWRKRLEVLRP